jgi:hypothetical protein
VKHQTTENHGLANGDLVTCKPHTQDPVTALIMKPDEMNVKNKDKKRNNYGSGNFSHVQISV